MRNAFAFLIAAVAFIAVSSPTFAAGEYTRFNTTTGQVSNDKLDLTITAPSTVDVNNTKTWPSIGAGASDSRGSHTPDLTKVSRTQSTVVPGDSKTWLSIGAGASDSRASMNGHL